MISALAVASRLRHKATVRTAASHAWRHLSAMDAVSGLLAARQAKMDAERDQVLASAKAHGIALEEEEQVHVPVWERGSIVFYSRENLAKRHLARGDARLLHALEPWWDLALRDEVDERLVVTSRGATVGKETYTALNLRLYRALIDVWDAGEAAASAEKVWPRGGAGERTAY